MYNWINLELEKLLNQNQIESGNQYLYHVLEACVGESYLVDLEGSDTGGICVGWEFLLCRLKPGLTGSVRDVRVGVMDMLFSQGRPQHGARQPWR